MLRREPPRGDPLKRPAPRIYVHARAPLGGWGLGTVPAHRTEGVPIVCRFWVGWRYEANVRRYRLKKVLSGSVASRLRASASRTATSSPAASSCTA